MPKWRDDKFLELANQLSYSPADKRREQLHAAIELLPAIDPAKTYPWDFVHFRITSFKPRTHIDHIVSGKILRADLAVVIEFLSDTLALKVDDIPPGDRVMLQEEISRKFSVSMKTIQRWRKQGLIALRYLFPDGKRRLGFLESAAAQFAALNKERVDRSAAFKQLTEEERTQILELARRFAEHYHVAVGIKDISQRIAETLNRSPETIRYTIRKHDRENPESAIFPPADAGPGPGHSGTPLEQAARRRSTSTFRAVTQERADRIKLFSIEFVPNPLFDHPDADNIILNVLPQEALARAQATVTAGTNARAGDVYMARTPRDLPAFLQDIFRQPLMPHELEIDAFRRMNYLKFKASKQQAALHAGTAAPTDLAEIETLLLQANELKNQIVQSNLRVAVHVARKHQRPDRSLMELVSDATVWLMRAAEKYDFARKPGAAGATGGNGGAVMSSGSGARFSTYASYAIMKNFARDRAEQLTRRDGNLITGQEEVLLSAGAPEADALSDRLDASALQSDLLSVIEELPARERELLMSHYGLDQTRPALSLAEIGDKMGITKARVRQLEARALRRLRLLLDTRREKLHQHTLTNPPPPAGAP